MTKGGDGVTPRLLWDGDGKNANAALTVFRHFDSATVVKGFVGRPPKTAWVVGYPLLERIHYLLVAGFDPKWASLYFDPIHAKEQWESELKRHLPRLRAVALKDFQMADGVAKACPMGQGIVDWPKFFGILAAAKYYGPVSLHMNYHPKDEIGSLTKDCAFAHKQINLAYKTGIGESGDKS